jgi:hypothetical protein
MYLDAIYSFAIGFVGAMIEAHRNFSQSARIAVVRRQTVEIHREDLMA